MKHLVRGTAGLVAAIGVLAGCADDPALDLAGAPTRILVNPSFLFIPQGDSQAVLIRTINDLNDAVLAKYEITNVGAGVSVSFDPRYRPDYNNPGDTLAVPELKYQQRYFVKALQPVKTSFQVRNGSLSSTVDVAVVPDTLQLGNGLNKTTAALGEEVTIAAPATLRFNDNSTVTFDPGGAAVITNRAADGSSITFLPRPGSEGRARVSNVTMRYAPAVAGQNMRTTNSLTVPAVTSIPATFSASTALAPVTLTATGFKFLSSLIVQFGTRRAFVVSVSADSNSAQVVLPTGITATAPTISNAVLSFLPAVPLTNVPGTNNVTTAATTSWNGANPDANAPTITAAAAGTLLDYYDTGDINYGADILGNGGPNKWYRLILPSAGARTYTLNWNTTADMDFYMTDAAITVAYVARATTANPETGSTNQPAGTYWLGTSNFGNANYPAIIRFRIQ